MRLWESCASQSLLTTLRLPYLTLDMPNSPDWHFCHRLFWSGNRSAVEYDKRTQSLRTCALQVRNEDTIGQAGQWLKFFGTKTGGNDTGRQESVWEVIPCILTGQGIPSDSNRCVYDAKHAELLCVCVCVQCTWLSTLRASLMQILSTQQWIKGRGGGSLKSF